MIVIAEFPAVQTSSPSPATQSNIASQVQRSHERWHTFVVSLERITLHEWMKGVFVVGAFGWGGLHLGSQSCLLRAQHIPIRCLDCKNRWSAEMEIGRGWHLRVETKVSVIWYWDDRVKKWCGLLHPNPDSSKSNVVSIHTMPCRTKQLATFGSIYSTMVTVTHQ